MENKLRRFFRSPKYKKLILVLGSLFFVSTFFIALNPRPFLRFGYFGVFVFNLFGPGTLIFPTLLKHLNFFWLSLATASGMALNDSVSWLVGRSGDLVIPRSKKVEKIEKTIHRFGPLALFFWSLIPFPYDLIGLIAGYLELPYKKFIFATFMGRFIRFMLLGLGIIKFFY